MGDVWIPVGSGQLPAFVSTPEQPAPWPGVVVLHDVAGMSEDCVNRHDGWRSRDSWQWRRTCFFAAER
jgi:dienelactone hydrolase